MNNKRKLCSSTYANDAMKVFLMGQFWRSEMLLWGRNRWWLKVCFLRLRNEVDYMKQLVLACVLGGTSIWSDEEKKTVYGEFLKRCVALLQLCKDAFFPFLLLNYLNSFVCSILIKIFSDCRAQVSERQASLELTSSLPQHFSGWYVDLRSDRFDISSYRRINSQMFEKRNRIIWSIFRYTSWRRSSTLCILREWTSVCHEWHWM